MKKVVLISGVSSGFGKQIANLLSENGHIVYGTVRKDILSPGNVNVLKMDLMDHLSIKRAVDTVLERRQDRCSD
jgi:NADP-dependent 3-hydroxy acid dehydrogenase YdfG